ncbi:flagellar assembly protein FliW [Caminibacter pacificus]|jgi:flagellar assembly factor FliW|uniref:Flagellar assembly factor FliW n=1 Tax=Caminibacter pacificus TaxID=1424653 RepID=A0AAJ4REA3_9BACT|nr:flagellar assembly protein FliW [Caminibacter pacificus]NPA87589.1 flagellar assembly protein FliW [Campylobacterota bacterium]QCI28277.1 hypothetical protein C6V80_04685 [Caminibacter pacificus]ROR41009.1 flagellar assembly factor FliW [Caminibacter pacificus]
MYKIKKPIPGFENFNEATFQLIDESFALLKINDYIFTLVNPFALDKNYSFEIPADVKVLLDIDEKNPPLVYCNLVRQEPFKDSIVNFKAPILLNPKNHTLAQVILEDYDYAPIKDFIKK